MRALFLGTPEVAAVALEVLAASPQIELVGIITQPDRPAGRGRDLRPPPVKRRALELGLAAPILQPETLRDGEAAAQIAALAPEVGIVAAYGEILRRAVLEIPPAGYLNIHPSLLPLYRGPAPVPAAILAGDAETGVSIIRLSRRMDAGPIVAQERVALGGEERAGALTSALFARGAQLLADALPAYMAGQIALAEQDEQLATYTALMTKQDGQVRWELPAAQIERMTRAYDPWPGVFASWRGQPLQILAARAHPGRHGAEPGALLDGPGVRVATGDGVLELISIQPAGKRAMPAADWRRGLRADGALRLE